MAPMLTARLEVRPPLEDDRRRFVELFQDPEFMVFSDGVHDLASANRRFDEMLRAANELPFAKQPVVERASGRVVGYSGVAWFDFEALDAWSLDIAWYLKREDVGTRRRRGLPLWGVRPRRFTVSCLR
jgi:RimJ/RimL family protein N-acetyltransferase